MSISTDNQHLVVPLNRYCTSYEGFLNIPEAGHLRTSLWIRVLDIHHQGESLEGARLEVSEEFAELLQGHEATVRLRMREAATFASFVSELSHLARQLLSARPPLSTPSSEFFSRLVSDVEDIGWDNVLWMDAHLTTFHFKVVDPAGREHVLIVRLSAEYPAKAPGALMQLPEPLKLTWRRDDGLPSLLLQCQAALLLYQDLWNCLEDLDKNAFVLEPEKPTPQDCERRLAIGQHCTLHIAFDPHHPRAYPQLSLMGPDADVAGLRELLHNGRCQWDESSTFPPWRALVRPQELNIEEEVGGPRLPRENLETVLGRRLPQREEAADMDDVSMSCCICYAYRLLAEDGQSGPVPDMHCDNSRCSRPFHKACLLEWLQSVPSTRKSFSTVFGECPFCESPIAVRSLCPDA